MKKYLIILLSLLLLFFTGCKSEESTPLDRSYNMALVFSGVNNNPVLDTSIRELSQLSSLEGSAYSFILADATPSAVCSGTVPVVSDRGYSEAMLERVHASVSADILSQLKSAAPDAPEGDLADAISLAVRTIRANVNDERTDLLVVYSSGISTSGLLNLVETPVYLLDVDRSVADLSEVLDWDLTGIQVVWYCCGDVSGTDQPPLSHTERATLKNFYQRLFQSKGCQAVEFRDDLPLDEAYHYSQPVSVMATEGVSSLLKVVDHSDLQEDEGQLFAEGSLLSFREEELRFLPDSTKLADTASAREALSGVISYLEANPDMHLLICGTTTSAGEKDSCRAFSLRRAKAVYKLLSEAGISKKRLHPLGCGWSSCLYQHDRTADGELDESVAPLNRSVVLLDYHSEAAGRIEASMKEGLLRS